MLLVGSQLCILWCICKYRIFQAYLVTYLLTFTSEQAGGKRSVWGCTEQLINKSILSEVRQRKRNLLTVWLDYRKAFDSVPHDWIIKALQLAKVLKNLDESIKRLTKQWATILNLLGDYQSITSDEIHYAEGIFLGDRY